MTTDFKKERLKLVGEIYNDNGNVAYLKSEFDEKVYERSIFFLKDKELIVPKGQKNYYSNSFLAVNDISSDFVVTWELTTEGIEYYEKEMENQKIVDTTTNIISAENSSIAINSNDINQNTQNNSDEEVVLPKNKSFLSCIGNIVKHPLFVAIFGGLLVAFLIYKFGWN